MNSNRQEKFYSISADKTAHQAVMTIDVSKYIAAFTAFNKKRKLGIYPTPMSFRFSPNEKVSFPPALS